MKPNPWPDFLFTITAHFAGGALMGGLACLVIGHRGILRALSQDNMKSPALWLAGCSLVGGLAGVLTTPHWQTPWYRGVRSRSDDGGI